MMGVFGNGGGEVFMGVSNPLPVGMPGWKWGIGGEMGLALPAKVALFEE
jgi:hypothetical protein